MALRHREYLRGSRAAKGLDLRAGSRLMAKLGGGGVHSDRCDGHVQQGQGHLQACRHSAGHDRRVYCRRCVWRVDLSEVRDAAWFSLPQFMHFGIKFEFSACIALALLFAINAIQAIGDLTATTVGGVEPGTHGSRAAGRYCYLWPDQCAVGIFRQPATATYSQNVGIVTTNKVVNRVVFALAGGFLLLAGLIPKFSAILTTIPQCVLGGATITVFSTIAMTGMKLIASETISPRNTTIVGLSAALGVGISQSSSALSQFPESITIIFGKTPVVIATIMAVLLNLILPQENTDQ